MTKGVFMKKIFLVLLPLVLSLGLRAEDAAISNTVPLTPTNETQNSSAVADTTAIPASSNAISTPIITPQAAVLTVPPDAPPPPTVASTTFSQSSTTLTTQPTYTSSTYPPTSPPIEHRFSVA